MTVALWTIAGLLTWCWIVRPMLSALRRSLALGDWQRTRTWWWRLLGILTLGEEP